MDVVHLTPQESTRVKERELLRVAAEMPNPNPAAAAKAAREQVLSWASSQVGGVLPVPANEGQSFEYLRGGRTCFGTSFNDDARSLWALRVDRPDANIAQRTWTTEVVVGYGQSSATTLFSLRLLVSSPETGLKVQPAVPGLVRKIAETCGLQQNGAAVTAVPHVIGSDRDAIDLAAELCIPVRRLPYLVCSVADGETEPRVDVRLLAKATMGLARVVVIPSKYTWALTEQFGKRRSVFNGAIRAYMPGFSNDANPFAHKLFLVDQTREGIDSRSTLTAARWIAANESIRRTRLGDDVIAFSVVRELSLDIRRKELERSNSSAELQLDAAREQIEALKHDVKRFKDEADQWLADYEQAEEEAQNYQQQLRGSQLHIQHLLAQLKNRGDDPDAELDLPSGWSEFGDWCDESLSGRVMLSSRARREIKSASFEEPKAAAQCLLWLANDYRDSRISGSGDDLRKPISDGVHNDRCGADSFDFDWNGRRLPVEWHIKNGGNTRDPRRCLRIYYIWDEEAQVVVIASMPGHIRTGAT